MILINVLFHLFFSICVVYVYVRVCVCVCVCISQYIKLTIILLALQDNHSLDG